LNNLLLTIKVLLEDSSTPTIITIFNNNKTKEYFSSASVIIKLTDGFFVIRLECQTIFDLFSGGLGVMSGVLHGQDVKIKDVYSFIVDINLGGFFKMEISKESFNKFMCA
jgi:hypothetical protein